MSFTSPILLTGIRTTAAGCLLLAINYLWGRTKKNGSTGFDTNYWLIYLQIIFFGVYLKYIARYWAIQYIPAIKMSLLANSAPFISALFGFVFLSEKITITKWLGLIIGAVGYSIILVTTSKAEFSIGEMLFISWSELITLLMVFIDCYCLILYKKLVRDHAHTSFLINGIQTIGGGLLALCTAFLFEPITITHPVNFVGWLSASITISNVACHSYSMYLLNYYSVTFVSFSSFLNTIFTGLYSAYFLQEKITFHYIIGGLTVIIGLYTFYKDELYIYRAKGANC